MFARPERPITRLWRHDWTVCYLLVFPAIKDPNDLSLRSVSKPGALVTLSGAFLFNDQEYPEQCSWTCINRCGGRYLMGEGFWSVNRSHAAEWPRRSRYCGRVFAQDYHGGSDPILSTNLY
jgi:hypothetical protein